MQVYNVIRDAKEHGAAVLAVPMKVPALAILYEKRIELKLSGNEVSYTDSLTLLVTNMLCSKLHCQKGFD